MKSMLLAVDFAPIIAPVLEVLNALLWPCIAIVGAVGTIYCIFLGIKIAKSDEQNSREKAKKDLIGAIVGFLIIFILIALDFMYQDEMAVFAKAIKEMSELGIEKIEDYLAYKEQQATNNPRKTPPQM